MNAVRKNSWRTSRAKKTLVAVIGTILLVVFAAFLRWSEQQPEQAFPARIARAKGAIDIVLVTVDAQRADFLTPYGEKLPTSPFLEKLAAQGVTFKNAFSPAPWTVPAMYSIITGLYPSQHGLTSGQTVGQHVVGQEALPAEAFTLTERLAGLGYTTFGINTNYHMAPQFGFNQGFDKYMGDDFAFMPYPNLAVAGLRDEILSSSKYFLWLHYFDPHFPYIAQPPWFGEWNDSRFRTLFDLSTDVSLRYYWHKRGLPQKSPIRAEDALLVHKLINLLTSKSIILFHGLPKVKNLVDENYIRFFTAAYKSTLRQTDESIETALKALGVDDQTLLIVTADHGEELFDHGDLGHRKNSSLYQELIRVPLLMYLPGGQGAGTVIDTPVSILDIYPTVLDLLDQSIPDDLPGRSLRPLIEGKTLEQRPVFAEVSGRMGNACAIIEYPWKYIHNYSVQRGELYHLEQDPGEKDNRADLEKARVKEMLDRLNKWKQSMTPRWKIEQTAPLSLPEIHRLKQMGYLK